MENQKVEKIAQNQQKNQENGETSQQSSETEFTEEDVESLSKQMGQMTVEDSIQKNIQQEKKEEGQMTVISEKNQSSVKQTDTKQIDETKYFVEVNRNQIAFGKNTLFPGSIEEVDVTIALNEESFEDSENMNPLLLRVIARCENAQFNDLDEYVFSVRSNQRFEYFEEVRFRIRRKQKAQVKVAVKIPPVSQNYTINGFLDIQLENLAPYCIPIVSKCEIPQITSVKDLYKDDEGTQMIKIPAKKNMPRMPPIPFKNLSNFNFSLEVQAISKQNFSNRPYDVLTQNFVNCQANSQFFVNMQLKQNLNYQGPKPLRDTIRKILVLKIKNSSVFFHFPIEVHVYEGKGNSMS